MQAPPDFSFGDLWQNPQQDEPLHQHRLLNDRGQAYSVPDLASASPDADLQELGHLLIPQTQAPPQTPGREA